MTGQKKKLDSITDSLYYYFVELVSQASLLEDIGLDNEGDELRSIADKLEQFCMRLLHRKHPRRRA